MSRPIAEYDEAADAPLTAVRALIDAAPLPAAVFDADGIRLAANAAFAAGMADAAAAEGRETRAPFVVGDGRHWTLVTLPAPAAPLAETQEMVARLARLGAVMPALFNAKDTRLRYLFINPVQAQLYRITPDAAIGRTDAELRGAGPAGPPRNRDLEVLASGRAIPFYQETQSIAGSAPTHWLTTKLPLTGTDGVLCGVVTLAIEVSERVRVETRLRQAAAEAERASSAKSGFLAAISHELRTPLNAVIGFAEIMQQEVLGPLGSPEYRDYAGHILASGRHLLGLINDILDYARIEAGALRLTPTQVELGQLVRGALAQIAAAAEEAGVVLSVETGHAPVMVLGDEARLRQALLAVVGNAVKFTPAGGEVAVRLEGLAGGAARVTISDTGIGITEADLSQVFVPFWQADSGLDRLRQGAGLGLPLARHLLELHGGSLVIESRAGAGSTVALTMPAPTSAGTTPR